MLINLNTDRWRRGRRETLTEEVPEPWVGRPAPAADQVELGLDLIRALDTLPRRERECVVLRHYLDLPEREVAATLGVSIGTVKSSTSRGLVALRAAPLEGEHSHV